MMGWRAHFTQDFYRDGYTLHLWRAAGDGRIEVAYGDLTVRQQEANVAVEPSGLFLPADCHKAIVEAIDPPAHKAEVGRLEEALAVERRRVDDILGRSTALPLTGRTTHP